MCLPCLPTPSLWSEVRDALLQLPLWLPFPYSIQPQLLLAAPGRTGMRAQAEDM